MPDVSTTDMAVRMALAGVLAGALGLERELDAQPAGFRTHVLVGLGAAMFSVAGADIDEGDPTRVAAQVVTGIGFLGAGAILRDWGRIRGLTTAASLWVTASIGVACGLGKLGPAAAVTGAALVVLTGLKYLEQRFFRRWREHVLGVEVEARHRLSDIERRLQPILGSITVRAVESVPEHRQRLVLEAFVPHDLQLVEMLDRIGDVEGVVAVELRS